MFYNRITFHLAVRCRTFQKINVESLKLKFQTVAEKTAKNFRGLLYFAAPGMCCVLVGCSLSDLFIELSDCSSRGVARIFGLGADHVVWSPTLRAPKLRSPCGGSGSSPTKILLIRMPEMHFPSIWHYHHNLSNHEVACCVEWP